VNWATTERHLTALASVHLQTPFKEQDARAHLYGVSEDKEKERRQMAAVGRRLRLLRGSWPDRQSVEGSSLCCHGKRSNGDDRIVGGTSSKHKKTHSFGRLEICVNRDCQHV